MRRMLGALVVAAAAVAVAHAHALYLVPDGDKLTVVFSDDLAPDANIKDATWKKLDGLKLTAVGADGKPTEVKWEKGEHCLTAKVPAGSREVFGRVEYGVSAKADAKPALTVFAPRAVLAAPGDKGVDAPKREQPVAAATGLVIHPEREAGKVRFRVILDGKPVAATKLSVIVPEKKEHADATTDDEGRTPAFEAVGRYGVTARVTVPKGGELNGQKYEETRHVATLVVDVK